MTKLPGLELPIAPPAPTPPRESERTVLDRLRVRYGKMFKNGDYVGRRYVIADAIVFDNHSAAWEELTEAEREAGATYGWGKRQLVHGFEVKVSRSDWLTELKDPEKAEAWSRYCHYFWLVAALKDIVRDDLPDGWGLLVAHGRSLRQVTAPTRRDIAPMPVQTVVSLTRQVQKTESAIALAKLGQEGKTSG